jgi:hypothetical protein
MFLVAFFNGHGHGLCTGRVQRTKAPRALFPPGKLGFVRPVSAPKAEPV